jgi:cobaltochelatase CobS
VKNYFITRDRQAVECEILEDSPKRRFIKITDKASPLFDKHLRVHPNGVAYGKIYPRVHEADWQLNQDDFFEYKGRLLLKKKEHNPLVPKAETYIFQPITSQLVDSILSGDKMLITGESGTGKTSHVVQIAARINQPIIRINLNGESRIGDFLGKIHVEGGRTFWKDGVLPVAMKAGYWLILDELDMAEPNILSLLHPVLEDDGRLVLKESDGEVVDPHPNFRIFATANSIGSMQNRADAYTGTSIMNEAFLDRWHILEMAPMEPKVEIKVLASKVPSLRRRSIKNIVQFANLIRNGKDSEVQTTLTFSTRRCLQWARKMALYRDAVRSAESVFLYKVGSDEKEWVIRTIKTVFATKRKEQKDEKEEE